MPLTEKPLGADRDEAFARLVEQYQPLIDKQVSLFAAADSDSETRADWQQEALIALFRAMENYREESGVPFAAYAKICVQRRLISCQRRLTWQTLLRPLTDEEEQSLTDDEHVSPEPTAISRLEERLLWERLQTVLTPFESECLRCHLAGYSYDETAVGLQTEAKAVDNALQRARRKLRRCLQKQPDFFRSDR